MNITFYSYKGGVGRTLALANAATHLDRINHRRIDVLAIIADFTDSARRWDEIIHAVEAAQNGALATARRADHRCNLS